jgi:hypothetical protein
MIWHPSTIDTAKSQIRNLILDLDFPINTTNYAPWLELAFEVRGKPFHRPRQSFSEAAVIEPIRAQQADPKKPAETFLEELMRRVKASHE